MQHYSELIVVQEPDVSGNDYAALLSSQGFAVRSCSALSRFGPLHHGCAAMGVVLVGNAQPLSDAIARVRRIDAAMAVVVVRAGTDVDLRIQALRAGADACYAADVSAAELAAALHALARRVPASHALDLRHERTERTTWASILHRSGGHGARAWRLLDGGCTLANPDDDRLRLTASERVLMAQLIGMAGRPIHRDAMAEAAWPSHAGLGANKPRSVDVLVSRLRRKAERQGMVLPVMAVRRWGYMFLGDVAEGSTSLRSTATLTQR